MAILEDDIKLLAAERLGDTDDAGGRLSGAEVVDGQENNLFPDLAERDRVIGRVNLAKAFAGVVTDDAEPYFTPNVIVESDPADPLVSLLLFSTGDWADQRRDARDRIEQYLARGPLYPGRLLEMQVAQSRAIALIQRESTPLPAVGEVLVLIHHEGQADEDYQFVRITKVEDRLQEFVTAENNYAPFTRRVVTCELTDPLRRDFKGPAVSLNDAVAGEATVRTTVVADAARYYGVKPLSAAAGLGDTQVRVDSLYTALVPSSQAEVPVNDLVAGATQTQLVQAGASVRLASNINGAVVQLGRAVMPGSVQALGPLTLSDQGDGTLSGGGQSGSVDYRTGTVRLPLVGNWNVDAAPAAETSGAAHTAEQAVTTGNRGYVWTLSLPVLPAPGTLTVDYRALGKWQRLADAGAGRLVSAGAGTGTVNYATGAVQVTLAALPDVGGSVLYAWSSPSHYRRGDPIVAPLPAPAYAQTLEPGLEPGSISVQWQAGGQSRTATDDGAGHLSGDAVGTVSYATGVAWVILAAPPDPGADLQWAYRTRPAVDGTLAAALSWTLPGSALPLRPGSLRLTVPVRLDNGYSAVARQLWLADDGAGGLLTGDGQAAGTVDYQTGEVALTLPETLVATLRKPTPS